MTYPEKLLKLIPDYQISRTTNINMLVDETDHAEWQGRYLTDLLEHIQACRPEGVLVMIAEEEYLLTLYKTPKEPPHG
jgi:hypothetical protein